MIIKIDKYDEISIGFDEVKQMAVDNAQPSSLLDLIIKLLNIPNEETRNIESIDDLDIITLDFESYEELIYATKINNKLISGDTYINVGTSINENVCEISVDSLTNSLVNISPYKIPEETTSEAIVIPIKSFVFNAKLNSIADFFNKYATDSLNSNVRESMQTDQFTKDTSQFELTLSNYRNNFYLYNNGITIITNHDIGVNENTREIILKHPQIINGAHTIGRYLYYKVAEKETGDVDLFDSVEIPLRIMVVQSTEQEFSTVSTDISAKINTQKPVVNDDLLFAELKRMNLISCNGLSISRKSNARREYVKLYASTILESPATAKNKMGNLIANSIYNCEPSEDNTIKLSTIVDEGKVFVDGKLKIELDNNSNYISLFKKNTTDIVREDEANNETILSMELHRIVNEEFSKFKIYISKRIKSQSINTKFDQYIISSFFYFMKIDYVESLSSVDNNQGKDYEKKIGKRDENIPVDSVRTDIFYKLSVKLVTEYTEEIAKYVLNEIARITNVADKNYISDNLKRNVPKNVVKEASNFIKGLNLTNQEDTKQLEKMLEYTACWDIMIKFEKFRKTSSNQLNDLPTFCDQYQYSAFTFKSDHLFLLYKELIPILYKKYIFEHDCNENKISIESVLKSLFT